ncbi:amino acid adenylation domain-containing protein [Paenibacillus sp. FSL H8-0048]|uniref:non-ribosomal peptide synthetase n=1 Tax=Paenibacillus sp. FSL H8-0048 TaxID=2954508 RepID=UPI0030FC37F4
MNELDQINAHILLNLKQGEMTKEAALHSLKILNQKENTKAVKAILEGMMTGTADGLKGEAALQALLDTKFFDLMYKLEHTAQAGNPANLYRIQPVETKDKYRLSSAQKRIFLLSSIAETGISYNMSEAIELDARVDVKQLETAFIELIRRHESLRTSFCFVEGEPFEFIHENFDFRLYKQSCDRSDLMQVMNDFVKPFDLEKGNLIRAALFNTYDGYTLLIDMHHIISDGISLGNILIDELFKLYNNQTLAPLKFQYKDFAEWQNNMLASGLLNKHEEYWMEQFKGALPVLELPLDYPRPLRQQFEGRHITFTVNHELTQKLKSLASSTQTTIYMVLLAAYNILLMKYSGQEDIVVGTPAAGRHHDGVEKLVGFFINMLPLRNYPAGDKTIELFLEEVKLSQLKAIEYQDYQYEEIINKLNVPRNFSRNPLFDTVFTFQSHIRKTKTAAINHCNPTSKFDLSMEAFELGDEIHFTFEYCTALFKNETMNRMIDHYLTILNEITKDKNKKIMEINMLTIEEQRRYIHEFNNTQAPFFRDKCIHELFEEQAARTPDRVALVMDREQMNYRELNELANRTARLLRGKGVGREDIVAVMMDHSFNMIGYLLGILKSGGAFLPIDPSYPEERVRLILEDSRAKYILVAAGAGDLYKDMAVIMDIELMNAEESCNPEPVNQSGDMAYLLYTSGSTGKPKGVAVEHVSLMNFFSGIANRIEFIPEKTILALTTISFDIFLVETLLPLTLGLKVVLAGVKKQLDPASLAEIINTEKVDMLQATPSRMQMIIDNHQARASLSRLSEIMIGGDVFQDKLLEEIVQLSGAKVYNMYGPTEATVWATVKELHAGERINLGSPLSNVKVYILDRNDLVQPIGVAGEICIGGEGVARGYFNNPELTRERFVPNPFSSKERIYRTGDLGKWLPDGEIEFLGRINNQIKIRGYRIEPGDIEAALFKHSSIHEALVMAVETDNSFKALCAYYTADCRLGIQELREYLLRKIPEYMVPAYMIQLDSFPISVNGKIDRRRLPVPEESSRKSAGYAPPASPAQNELAELWSELLHREKDTIGMDDNFFNVGGDSLLLVKMQNRIEAKHPGQISVGAIFASPTIRGLSKLLDKRNSMNKKVSLDSLPIPEHYFVQYYTDRPVGSIQHRLPDHLVKKLQAIGAIGNLHINTILAALYLYLFMELSGQEQVTIQAALSEKGAIAPVSLCGSEIDSIMDLVKETDKQLKETMSEKYRINEINEIIKAQPDIIPLILEKDRLEMNEGMMDFYDIIVSLEAPDEYIQFKVMYNARRLKPAEMEQLFMDYVELISVFCEEV